jgi:uncharacterized protein (TIGR02271 family)
MSRIVTALYDSRPEAETARARLGAESNAENMRILTRDTAGAIDGLKISPRDADTYRNALRSGDYLLVAEVPGGQDPQRIVDLLTVTADRASGENGRRLTGDSSITDEVRIPRAEEELRIGKRTVERGGARVHSIVRETNAQEDVVLRDEHLDVETRPSDRRLSDADVASAGLLKNRVIEVSEMREEPVVTKSAVVREEVVLKKSISERVETVRDTVRHTEVEVEELPSERPALRGLGDGNPRQEERRR